MALLELAAACGLDVSQDHRTAARISATLVMAGFFLTLRHVGWHPGAATGPGTPLNHGYRQATTVAWLGIVACQVGTAFAVRTDHASCDRSACSPASSCWRASRSRWRSPPRWCTCPR